MTYWGNTVSRELCLALQLVSLTILTTEQLQNQVELS